MINWHRILGVVLTDYFTDTLYEVELEKDLSIKQQLLDVVIIKKGEGEIREDLCDGFENLREHNLLTYKSIHESLSLWVLEELMGYYVMYRKLTGAEDCVDKRIGLYAVCTRYPKKLLSELELQKLRRGVYEVKVLSCVVRIIVLREIKKESRNAIWNMFSMEEEKVTKGMEEYKWKMAEPSTIVNQLIKMYVKEGMQMAYTMEDFKKDYIRENLGELEPEERLKGLPAEERLKGLPAEERLKGLPAEERLKGLPAEERLKGLPAEERLKGLSPKVIEAYLEQIKKSKK